MGYECVKGRGECTGCMDCQPSRHYFCPVCGNEVFESVFVSYGEIIGCENCAEIKEPHEVLNDEAD